MKNKIFDTVFIADIYFTVNNINKNFYDILNVFYVEFDRIGNFKLIIGDGGSYYIKFK